MFVTNIFDAKVIHAQVKPEQNNLRNLVIDYSYLDQFDCYGVFIRRGLLAKQHCSRTT